MAKEVETMAEPEPQKYADKISDNAKKASPPHLYSLPLPPAHPIV